MFSNFKYFHMTVECFHSAIRKTNPHLARWREAEVREALRDEAEAEARDEPEVAWGAPRGPCRDTYPLRGTRKPTNDLKKPLTFGKALVLSEQPTSREEAARAEVRTDADQLAGLIRPG